MVLPTIDLDNTKGWQDPKEYGTREPMPRLLERNRSDTAPKDGESQDSQQEPSPSLKRVGWVDDEDWNVRNGPLLKDPVAKQPGENKPHAKKHGETVHKSILKTAQDKRVEKRSTSSTKKHGEITHPPTPDPKKIQLTAREERAAQRSNRNKVQVHKTKVETVIEEDEEDYQPAMSEPKIGDLPIPDELPGMDKDLPYYVPPSDKPYKVLVTPNKDGITQGMLDFTMDKLRTDGKVEKDLHPEDMIRITFLMPAMDDGSRARPKIIERIDEH